jgi:hypothetical protein
MLEKILKQIVIYRDILIGKRSKEDEKCYWKDFYEKCPKAYRDYVIRNKSAGNILHGTLKNCEECNGNNYGCIGYIDRHKRGKK